jgi:hypothetical protein
MPSRLTRERIHMLEKINFLWSASRGGKESKASASAVAGGLVAAATGGFQAPLSALGVHHGAALLLNTASAFPPFFGQPSEQNPPPQQAKAPPATSAAVAMPMAGGSTLGAPSPLANSGAGASGAGLKPSTILDEAVSPSGSAAAVGAAAPRPPAPAGASSASNRV